MVNENDELKKERYSFSKLTSFLTCKYGYMQSYVKHLKGTGNCFSSFGSEVHSIMERYAKQKISLWNLPDVYEWEFEDAVPEKFPDSKFCPNMRELYYNQGLDFLKNFQGYDDVKILEVESEFEYDIDDWVLNGVIDLVYEDKDGKIILQDYKSKSKFKNKIEQHKYARQLYLYSLYILKKYGRYPDELRFLMFRKNNIISIPFNIQDLSEAVAWARNTVAEIRECWDYEYTQDEFYCNHLCNHREYCEFKSEEK